MVLIGVTAAICVVLIVLAFLAPKRSREWENKEDAQLRGAERQEQAKGPVHQLFARGLDRTRRAADKSMDTGRAMRERS